MIIIRFLKELYLTIFVVGYRARIAGGWGRINPRFGVIMDIGKGVLLVWLIAFFIVFGIKQCIEIYIRKRFFDSSPLELVVGLALYFLNHYVLVLRGHGIKFEQGFNNLEKSRKILLVTTCCVLILATIVFGLYVRSDFQRFFYGHP